MSMLNFRFLTACVLAGSAALGAAGAAGAAGAQQPKQPPSCPILSRVIGQGSVGPAQRPVAVRQLDLSDLDVRYDRAVLYKSALPVFSAGAPDALHAEVLDGSASLARLCDAVSGYRIDARDGRRQRALSCEETESAFAQYRRAGWQPAPDVELVWRHAIAATLSEARGVVPCVVPSGPYQGFLGSRTVLRNGLGPEAGACGADDQVNAREVPGIAIPAGANGLRAAGVRLGDLALAVNTRTRAVVPAVVMDAGPPAVPALGTLALNARLTGQDAAAVRTRAEAVRLNIDAPEVVIAIFPNTAGFRLQRPYTAQNVAARVAALLETMGHGAVETVGAALDGCRGAVK